jgi:adenylate cyclase class 2
MSAKGQELEVKFLAPDLASIQARLEALDASQVQPRVHETNLRFDTPVGDLGQSSQVLRLRQDTAVRMTYKGPGEVVDGIRKRQELEFSVSDFEMGRAFLEALGYQVVWMYEKYRQMFQLGEVLVTLDEMPFGNFIEIEGPDGASIQAMAGLLDMDWKLRILESYSVLFEDARAALGFTFRDLSFENFEGVDVPAALFAG